MSDSSPPINVKPGLSPVAKKVLTGVCASLAALSLLLALAVGTAAFYQGRVLPRTFLAGIGLGSQPYDKTIATISSVSESVNSAPLTVTLDDSSSQIAPADLGLAIDVESAENEIINPSNKWDWAKASYWRDFFSTKHLALSYTLDEQKFKTSLADRLTSSEIAVDAEIVLKDGQLTVTEAKIGRSINIDQVRSSIENYLAGRAGATISVAYQPTQPQITTEEANRTKAEIEAATRPIYLVGDNKKFTLSAADQYGLISYQKNGDQLEWRTDPAKLTDWLTQRISAKLDIKMVQRVIQSQPEVVLTEGKDGRQVDVTALAKAVTEASANKTDTAAAPIVIPLATVTFTDRWVDPSYRTDRFDGLYLEVNLKNQHIYVIQDHVKINEWLISSGKPGTPTPEGQYYIMNKIEIAQSKLFPGLWMQKWNALTTTKGSGAGYDGFGLHRVPCFNKECTIREPQTHLGKPVSHGCIRIADEGADWVYANAPIGTPVTVHY